MGDRGKRVRVAEHVYRDRYGYEIAIRRAGHTYTTRRPLDTSDADLRRAVADLLDQLERDPAIGARGTLARDIERYLALASHLTDVGAQRAHLRAALPHLGHLARSRISRHDVLAMRAAWLDAGVTPKTVNNRLSALRALWRLLDGEDESTPFDGLKALRTHRVPPRSVSPATIAAVDARLGENERRGWLRDAKTRARFRVLATTGVRPSELMRAQRGDLDLGKRIWQVRDGKGGYRPVGVPLIPAAIEAWQMFIAADAWGPFNVSSYAKVLRSAGWPADVRPYALRSSLGDALSEHDVDLADISLILGHTRVQTTREHYVGPKFRRMRAAMDRLADQLIWRVPTGSANGPTPLPPVSGRKTPVGTTGPSVGRKAKRA